MIYVNTSVCPSTIDFDLPLSLIYLGDVGLCLSLMIVQGSFRFSYLNTSLMRVLSFQIFVTW